QSAAPLGFLDSVTGQQGQVAVSGWAGDPDSSGDVPIHVYLDGSFAGGAVASGTRFDVSSAFPSLGSTTGFSFVVPATAGTHSVCVYALNDGPNAFLGCRTTTVATGSPPRGNLETVVRTSSTAVRVAGWVGDAGTTNPVPVHVYVDGSFAAGRLASNQRGDVAAAFPELGASTGFDLSVAVTAGTHQVCVYALNDDGPNLLLGCRTVT
ncbi:MAG: hypothetical protein KDB21_11360, partial [Acidimicrobiales bacterium]|nr:hypothetical protein [Acidimicrobiales bacterium]